MTDSAWRARSRVSPSDATGALGYTTNEGTVTAQAGSGPDSAAPIRIEFSRDLSESDGIQRALVQLLADHRGVVLELPTLPTPQADGTRLAIEQRIGEPRRIVLTRPRSLGIKRVVDLTLVISTAPIWVPAVGLLALLVRCTSPGPALYAQRRIGQFGHEIRCPKLRTMVLDADERLQALLASDPELRHEYLTTFKLKRDPRITRIGGFLRRTGLDELPQLVSVLKGDMSLVGPRPVTAAETIWYGPYRSLVAAVPPGVTGLWQVSGRNDLPYEQRVALDVEYAVARTLLGDLKIMIRTLAVMTGRSRGGAY